MAGFVAEYDEMKRAWGWLKSQGALRQAFPEEMGAISKGMKQSERAFHDALAAYTAAARRGDLATVAAFNVCRERYCTLSSASNARMNELTARILAETRARAAARAAGDGAAVAATS